MGTLTVPRHTGEMKYIMTSLQVYADYNDWMPNEVFIPTQSKALGEPEVGSDKTHYTKDAEIPRYFGFAERKQPGNKHSDVRISESGKIFLEAWNHSDFQVCREQIMLALEKITFGRNNEGCGSDSDVEAPNACVLASLLLDGIFKDELAYILDALHYKKHDLSKACIEVLSCRFLNKKLPKYTVTEDQKYVQFMRNVGFFEDATSGGKVIIKLPFEVKKKYFERIKALRIFNSEELKNGYVDDDLKFDYYSPYRQFITAIKSKPFLLLAGISGTGKSRIVRELARSCWEKDSDQYAEHEPENFEMVQVKPNWHDSTELIGYISRVSGTPIFIAGKFLKFIVKAWCHESTPYFLCLDEMNLAPVEQYFAEFLSVIESRKKYIIEGEKTVITDPILKPEYEIELSNGDKVLKVWYDVLLKELLADCPTEKIHALYNKFKTEGISLPPNLIVIGTVNMDETTFSFSRKVLDRAMTIEMNEVDLHAGLTTSDKEDFGLLGSDDLVGLDVEGKDVFGIDEEVSEVILKYLEAINSELQGTPFKIAYRTRNEFLLYVINNLRYNKDEKGNRLSKKYVVARALDEITSMKILSRIEGDSSKVPNEMLDMLREVIKSNLDNLDIEESEKGISPNLSYISISKLDEMNLRLQSGYTSFWS